MTKKEFISAWITTITNDGIKLFPSEFTSDKGNEVLNLPEKTLIIGGEFFGSIEILTTEGTPILQADNYDKAKYIIYANRTKPGKINIPKDNLSVKKSVSKYESYLDEIIKQIDKDFKKKFPGERNSGSTVNEIFKLLNLVRY